MKISTWLRKKTDGLESARIDAIWEWHQSAAQFLFRFRVFRWLDRAAYWLRTHTWDRYHMVDIRSRRNGYAWGWMDRSEGMLFAVMAMLVAFVEQERAFQVIDWDSDDGHREAVRELREIYLWWTQDRKIEHDEHERLADEAYEGYQTTFVPMPDGMLKLVTSDETPEQRKARDDVREAEDRLDQKDTDMMIRLIKVREAMWT
jgi:hypothetical protein